MEPIEVDCGYCQCGCGRKTEIIKNNDKRYGRVKGRPSAYCFGHNHKTIIAFVLEDRGYKSPCWIWRRHIQRGGYALMSHWLGNRCNPNRYAHRYYYEFLIGPVPEGLDLDHLCRVRCCVNPNHLEPVTPAENCRRGAGSKLTLKQIEEILELRRNRVLMKDISARYRVHISYLEVLCRRGKTWTNIRLTENQKKEMLEHRKNGMKLKDVAALYGIHVKCAGTLCRRGGVYTHKRPNRNDDVPSSHPDPRS